MFILVWLSRYLQKDRINTVPRRTEGNTHTFTSTHYSKWGVLMLRACDKSSSQFHSICHHSQLPTDPKKSPDGCKLLQNHYYCGLRATIAWSDKIVKSKSMSMYCINFFSLFFGALEAFDHLRTVSSFSSFFPPSQADVKCEHTHTLIIFE